MRTPHNRFNRLSSQARAFVGLILMLALVHRAAANSPTKSSPKQGADLLKTDLMVVLAHPDDETMMAPLIARTALLKQRTVANIYCTRGEGGGNMVGTQGGSALGILREVELRDGLRILGVRHTFFLDQRDFAYTESATATLSRWNKEEALRALVRLMRALQPDVVLTIHPAPFPGQHGHHQTAGLLATEAFNAAADPSRFPDQISLEGLTPWQPRKLYYSGTGPDSISIPSDESLPDGRTPGQVAGEALSNHRSQAFGNIANAPWLRRAQSVTLIKAVVWPPSPESDLFDHLPSNPDPTPSLSPKRPSTPPNSEPLALEFIPRPAIQRFQEWSRAQGVDPSIATLKADLPVVAGRGNRPLLRLSNAGDQTAAGSIQITLPPGGGGASAIPFSIAPKSTQDIPLDLQLPDSFENDAELKASIQRPNTNLTAIATIHPLPKARVPRLSTSGSPWDTSRRAAWTALPSIAIPHTRTAQGKPSGPTDCSAIVRVAHDGTSLFVEVDVTDDTLVSNIAPNDIKGHWRSDSVELCIDPQTGAEHTFGTFKLGVFPFDSDGRVRAARDADAKPGPVETTAPNVRLHSEKTATGYRIQATIPLATADIILARNREIGFNVIVYDGDKSDAAPGENINKSRIAWAPRSGVQGRPEDWGRLILD